MLCQLVCIDKRYHKINCFNISEAQSLLKKKFFLDLINNRDVRLDFLGGSSSIRFKANDVMYKDSNQFIAYNYNPSLEISSSNLLLDGLKKPFLFKNGLNS